MTTLYLFVVPVSAVVGAFIGLWAVREKNPWLMLLCVPAGCIIGLVGKIVDKMM